MRVVASYFIGLLFGFGMSLSGMANPAKVLNFFDVAGAWDPSLAFVMAGALLVTAVGYRVVLARPAPVLADTFQVPNSRDLDLPLIGGAAVFGVGWGIAGFCPGGALPALGTGRLEVIVFVGALCAGIVTARSLKNARAVTS